MNSLMLIRFSSLRAHSELCPIFNKYVYNKDSFDKRQLHSSPVKQTFFESDPKDGYGSKGPKPSTKELLRHGLKQIKQEIKLWQQEVRNSWEGDFLMQGTPGVVDKKFEFKKEEDLNKWIVTSDKDHDSGESTCELRITQNGKGLFTGNLCLDVPKDGIMKRTGFCNIRTVRYMKSFQRDAHYDWGMYNMLVLRVRGDGRSYGLNLSIAGYYDNTWNDMYTYVLFTRGGPYWQYSRIPFSKFFFTSKGRIQDMQGAIPLSQVAHFGITQCERSPGPFCLEIDYIGLEWDPTHQEEFAYEMYKLPHGLANT